ncbi:hypothetical protein [Anaeromyxobacter diazotrophicus]|uniref:DUF2029 domain-containing protein n=1 Tax=Anaeromyxobacter diazotrophicus TaxID=2590199 RepID=A0A7I9VKV0_9BACT|nr:hypothetical protein [Anaeromyxobacter diazotrophicus]GEJ57044.1 hypothetical protein AMYX_17850 [Anaeromyxobacter diazotrophicus]
METRPDQAAHQSLHRAPTDSAALTLGAAICAIALGLAIQVRDGHLAPTAVAWLTLAIISASLGMSLPRLPSVERIADTLLPWTLLAGLLIHSWSFLTAAPAQDLRIESIEQLRPFYFGIAALTALGGAALGCPYWLRRWHVALVLLVFVGLGTWLITASPSPFIDVVEVHNTSISALLQGTNPYTITFPDIYNDPAMYGPGMVKDGRLMFGYTYPPLSLLLATLGSFAGDYRYALLAAITIAAGCIAYARPTGTGVIAATLLLLTPRSLFVLEQGWTEPFVLMLVSATAMLSVRRPRLALVTLGLLLAVKQYAVLFIGTAALLPLWRDEGSRLIRVRAIAVTMGVAAVVTLPFLLWSPVALFRDLITTQLHLPFRGDSLSYSAWWAAVRGQEPHYWVGFALAMAAGILVFIRAPRTASGFTMSFGFVFLWFVVFNRQAFCNYYYLILGCMFASVGMSTHRVGPAVAHATSASRNDVTRTSMSVN